MLEPPVDRVRISQAGKDQLIKLKRITKIDQWNILCRWAFCRSLVEPTPPSPIEIPSDSNLEISWQVFGGDIQEALIIALKQRCMHDLASSEPQIISSQFRLHLHRGIGYLAADSEIKTIASLLEMVIQESGV